MFTGCILLTRCVGGLSLKMQSSRLMTARILGPRSFSSTLMADRWSDSIKTEYGLVNCSKIPIALINQESKHFPLYSLVITPRYSSNARHPSAKGARRYNSSVNQTGFVLDTNTSGIDDPNHRPVV